MLLRASCLYILFFLLTVLAKGQTTIAKNWTLTGRVLNTKASALKFRENGLLIERLDSLSFHYNHRFELSEPIIGQSRITFLINGRPHFLYCLPGETVHLEYNAASGKILNLAGATAAATRRLNYDFNELFDLESSIDSVFRNIIDKAASVDMKYELCNRYYQSNLTALIGAKHILGTELGKYINELYFTYLNYMNNYQLSDFGKLYVKTPNKNITGNINLQGSGYFKIVSKQLLLTSVQYRLFLFNRIRRLPDARDNDFIVKLMDTKKSAPWIEYNRSDSISDNFVREWFMARSILFSFQHYQIDETEKIMSNYLSSAHIDYFQKAITVFWTASIKFEAGAPAPDFQVRNEAGKAISLRSLRGKYVLINFWGVHCIPCIDEIVNSYPALIQKYKDSNLIIMNICLDESKENWKRALIRYKLGGINCWSNFKSDISHNYNITSIPHYVIIDPEGKISDYNAPGPISYLSAGSEIDRLLEKVQ